MVECIDAQTLAKIIQIIVLTASKVKSQSSAVRPSKAAPPTASPKGATASPAAKKPLQPQPAHTLVKQQVKLTLDEVDDWEW